MNLSGILVVARPDAFDACVAALRAQEGVEVHYADRDTSRIVIVQSAADCGAEAEAFARIRALPGALTADLVYHYFGDTHVDDFDRALALERLAGGATGALAPIAGA